MTSHIEKGRHRKTILSERKCFLCDMAVEDEKRFVMECDIEIFFDDLEQIVPSFSSKNVDEKFTFIVECKDYEFACVCITNIG